VALVVLLRAALPALLESALPRLASSRAGARAEVANIDLGLFAGEITLEDLRVGLPAGSESDPPLDDETALLRIERLRVALSWRALLARRVHIADLSLEAPHVRLIQREDGSLLLPAPPAAVTDEASEAPAEPAADPPEANEPSAGWEFVVDRFELRGAEVSLHAAGDEEEVLRFAAESLGVGSFSFGPEGIVLGGVTLERPALNVERGWLLALGGGASEAAPSAESGEPTRVSVKHLEVNSAGFTVRTQKGPLDVAMRLTVDDAGTAPGQAFPVELQLRIGEGTITTTGQLAIAPFAFEGRLVWSDLAVPPFTLITNPGLLPWFRSVDSAGELELVIRTRATEAAPAGVRAKGTVQVADVSIADPESGELALVWERLDLELRSAFWPLGGAAGSAPRIEIERLALLAPEAVYTRPPEALERFLVSLGGSTDDAGDTAAAPDAAGGAPAQLTIDSLEVSDGQLRFADRSVTPNHETLIRDLRVVGAGVATQPVAAARSIEMTGRVQEAGTFALNGELPDGNGELGFELNNLLLLPYAPFAREAGWIVRSGESTLNSKIGIRGDRYEVRNDLVLHDLDVGQDDPSQFAAAFGVPLDVALALLRDPFGDIELSIPVDVSGEGVGVDLPTIVASSLREALAGALLSPFKIVGVLLPDGGGPVSFEPIAFAPGASELSGDVAKHVKRLAKLLRERPRLGLTLVGHSAPDDRPELARAILREKALTGDDFPEVDGDGLLARRRVVAALRDPDGERLAELDPDDRDLLTRYVAAQPVSEERLDALASARANAVREALLRGRVGADVVRVGDPEAADEAGVALKLTTRAMSNAAAR
jgi:hypothetical protein